MLDTCLFEGTKFSVPGVPAVTAAALVADLQLTKGVAEGLADGGVVELKAGIADSCRDGMAEQRLLPKLLLSPGGVAALRCCWPSACA